MARSGASFTRSRPTPSASPSWPLAARGGPWRLWHCLVISALAALFAEALPGRIGTLAPLFAAFALGMAAHVFRDRLRLSPTLALVAMPFAVFTPWPIAIAILGYAAPGPVASRSGPAPARRHLLRGLHLRLAGSADDRASCPRHRPGGVGRDQPLPPPCPSPSQAGNWSSAPRSAAARSRCKP